MIHKKLNLHGERQNAVPTLKSMGIELRFFCNPLFFRGYDDVCRTHLISPCFL